MALWVSASAGTPGGRGNDAQVAREEWRTFVHLSLGAPAEYAPQCEALNEANPAAVAGQPKARCAVAHVAASLAPMQQRMRQCRWSKQGMQARPDWQSTTLPQAHSPCLPQAARCSGPVALCLWQPFTAAWRPAVGLIAVMLGHNHR